MADKHYMMHKGFFVFLFFIIIVPVKAQHTKDTIPVPEIDSSLRIINFNPFFTLHVDSTLSYQFDINREKSGYFWYLKNSPVGLKINKDNGLLTFKAEKSFFLTGKLKYDAEYKVNMGVQSLTNPGEKVDTTLTLIFYNTEILPSRVKPTVAGILTVDEGEPVSFNVQCETGSFPIEDILFTSSRPIGNFTLVKFCNDEFNWTPDYEFVKETDSAKVKIVTLSFIGSTRFKAKDTAMVRIIVRDALNYPLAVKENEQLVKSIETYILQLKYSFLQLDKRLKKVKSFRTSFDLTSGTTALAGTILNSSNDAGAQKTGKILPGVGVALVPIKEAAAPNKVWDQNQASLIRSSIKRLEYLLRDNMVVDEKDPDMLKKTNKLKEELKQIQIQLIDIPIELTNDMTAEELNEYFNSPKVNKKYRLKGK
ncbi:MAG: hypothetical protein EPN92_03665 [Chitinophagaceae bacterium]|nr:MAG: hypothetical protein EPN92_03665 [Chitinophagaceae bacterium]